MKNTFERFLLLAAVFWISGVFSGCNHNYPTGTIEQKYYATGSWSVTVKTGGACCDSLNNQFDLYYPTNLGAGGFLIEKVERGALSGIPGVEKAGLDLFHRADEDDVGGSDLIADRHGQLAGRRHRPGGRQ